MQTASFVEALQADLRELASLGGDDVAAAADRLAAAIRSSAGLRLLDALSEAALEISAQLPSGHVDIRVAGQDPQFVYVEEAVMGSHRLVPAVPDALLDECDEGWVIAAADRSLARRRC